VERHVRRQPPRLRGLTFAISLPTGHYERVLASSGGLEYRRSTALMLGAAVFTVAVVTLVVAPTRTSSSEAVAAPTTVPTCAPSAADAADFVDQVHQSGGSAFESRPVKVTSNGTYKLIFGPLGARDLARFKGPTGAGFGFPIMSDEFVASADGAHMTTVVTNGATYVHVPLVVTDYVAPCMGLVASLQF
jgi:hypothetical protein